MLIENYIPKGYKNRVSRETLEKITRQSDRKNRKQMEDALLSRGVLIINIDNGYFIPDGSAEDKMKSIAYYHREVARTSSCSARCKAIKGCLAPQNGKDDITKNQLSLFDMGVIT